jgi:transposase
MGLIAKDDRWTIPDSLWARMEPLLPARPQHPLGCHNPRVPDRAAMTGILFVLRTGCQWNALDATGICSCSSAYRRFREWLDAGVFHEFWRQGLLAYDRLKGIDWDWLSMDGAMTKAPLGGEKNGTKPNRSRKGRHQAQSADRRPRGPGRPRGRWRERERLPTDA